MHSNLTVRYNLFSARHSLIRNWLTCSPLVDPFRSTNVDTNDQGVDILFRFMAAFGGAHYLVCELIPVFTL